MVDVSKRKLLDFIENIMSQILCKTCRRYRSGPSRKSAEQEGKHCHNYQDQPCFHNITQIALGNSYVDDLCHLQRDQDFQEYFQDYKDRCLDGLFPVFPDGTQ